MNFPRSLMLMSAAAALACADAGPPPPYRIVVLRGDAYQRGLQHGRELKHEIRSFYTRMLTNSLTPSLARERPGVSTLLMTYQDKRYDGNGFAEAVLGGSARNLAASIPDEFKEEMRGIADGAGMDYEEILVLNTVFDTLLGVRSLQSYLNYNAAPKVTRLGVAASLATDGLDNDGDGSVDEAEEHLIDALAPASHASLVEVPTDSTLTLRLEDEDGIDLATVEVTLDGMTYRPGDGALTASPTTPAPIVDLLLTPTSPLPGASAVALSIRANDLSRVEQPPPAHARVMREHWITLGTRGLGQLPATVPNVPSRALVAPSIGFATRGGASAGGEVLLGHHFALLDAGVSHEHTVAFVSVPSSGPAQLHVGWAGVIWGMAGMNSSGLSYGVALSDSLDNPTVDEVRRSLIAATVTSRGVPIGILGRMMLAAETTTAAAAVAQGAPRTGGWNILLADEAGDLAVIELDSNGLDSADGGFMTLRPADLDGTGRPLVGVGGDALRMTSHFVGNTEDYQLTVLGFALPAQRHWSPTYFRSLAAHSALGGALAGVTAMTPEKAMTILRQPRLVDRRDSMTAAVFDGTHRTAWFALGEVPATDAPFVRLSLTDVLSGDLP